MDRDRLQPFRDLLSTHRSARHPLFQILLEHARAGRLDVAAYRVFAANLATRTMLTLPEIHTSCVQAALDLDPVRTAYGVMTGAEEGGFGRPEQVHTRLMTDALNNHGRVAFGLPPIDLRRLMAAIRLAHVAGQSLAVLETFGPPNPKLAARLRAAGVFDCDGSVVLCRTLCRRSGLTPPRSERPSAEEWEELRTLGLKVLSRDGVIPETIDYCLAQLALPADLRPGYIQGVGFAHEGLADGMIFSIFQIAYASLSRYSSEERFMALVYPYFAAHGDYISVVRGEGVKPGGVEAVHAEREFAKLAELDDDGLAAAWTGANDFADRNVRIWDGLLDRVVGFDPGGSRAPRPVTTPA